MSPLAPPVLLAGLLLGADPIDWPSLTQAPYEGRAIPDPGLPPLLANGGGLKITTRQGWEEARSALLHTWREHLGTQPEVPASLDARVEETEKADGYTRQRLSFAAEGDDRIRAYLLVPEGLKAEEKRPAVVVFHETTRDTFKQPAGLGQKPELALAVHLTRRGYVTLSPECFILKALPGEADATPIGRARGQAGALARRRPGWTGLGKMTFDASRCIDLLETVPTVDAGRVGCIGFSLGAKEALYALAFEPRYKAGVANEGGVGLRMSNWFDPWYLGAAMKDHVPAFENHQVLALVAPRPILILAGGSADGDASWPFVRAVLPVYDLYGARDRVGLYDHGGKHSFPRAGREVAYRWLDHWLGHTPTREEVGP